MNFGRMGAGFGRLGVNGASGSDPSPPTIPEIVGADLLAYWDAERADLMSLGGSGEMAAWADVQNGYNPVQATGSLKPIRSATSFNGAAGATFDGTDDQMTLASQPLPSGANPVWLWAVVQQDALVADTGDRAILSFGGASFTQQARLQRVVSGGVNRAALRAGDGSSFQVVTNTSVDFSSRHLVIGKMTGTQIIMEVDGVASSPVACVPGTGTTRLRIGAIANDTATFFWLGKVAVICATNPLSSEVESDLKTNLLARRML